MQNFPIEYRHSADFAAPRPTCAHRLRRIPTKPVNPVHTDNAPAAIGAYSQATLAEGFLFTSGQLGLVPATGALAEGVEAQARQAFANLEAICAAAGTTLGNTVKMTIFLADINEFAVVNKVMTEVMSEPYPARSCFAVAALPKAARVEIEAVVTMP